MCVIDLNSLNKDISILSWFVVNAGIPLYDSGQYEVLKLTVESNLEKEYIVL
jgi:hypothetical protein